MGRYADINALSTLAENIKDTLVIKDKTEAQAIAAASTYPNNIYYTSDTHNLVQSGHVISSGIGFGTVDSTSTSTAFTATVPGVTEYKDGTAVMLRNNKVTSAANFTININGLGAKPAYNNMATGATPTRDTTIFNANYTMLFVYSSTIVSGGGWICYRGYNSDNNTIGYQLRTNSTVYKASDTSRYYKIFFTSADGNHLVPASVNSTNNATSARPVNQRPIDPFGRIAYTSASTNYPAEGNIAATTLWEQYNITLGYSFNRTGEALTLTTSHPVYVKCAPQNDGSAIMDADTPIVQALPSTEDGKIYIFLGIATSATAMELYVNHPVYYYKNGAIRLWTNDHDVVYESMSQSEADTGTATTGRLVSASVLATATQKRIGDSAGDWLDGDPAGILNVTPGDVSFDYDDSWQAGDDSMLMVGSSQDGVIGSSSALWTVDIPLACYVEDDTDNPGVVALGYTQSGNNFPLQLDSNGRAFTNVLQATNVQSGVLKLYTAVDQNSATATDGTLTVNAIESRYIPYTNIDKSLKWESSHLGVRLKDTSLALSTTTGSEGLSVNLATNSGLEVSNGLKMSNGIAGFWLTLADGVLDFTPDDMSMGYDTGSWSPGDSYMTLYNEVGDAPANWNVMIPLANYDGNDDDPGVIALGHTQTGIDYPLKLDAQGRAYTDVPVEDIISGRVVIKDKTEAQALSQSTSNPNNVYYTNDTYNIVVDGNVYGDVESIGETECGEIIAEIFGEGDFGSSYEFAADTSDQANWDTSKIYYVPSSTAGIYNIYSYSNGAWSYTQSSSSPIPAANVSYDRTNTPNLGNGNVQSAIEALKSQKVEYTTIEGNNVQLKDGNGNLLLPKTEADVVTLEGNNLTDLQTFMDDEINVMHTATFPELSTTPINAWSRKNVAAGNKYIVNGYITKIVIYGGGNGNIDYGVIDLSTTPYTLTKYGNTTITTGKNVIIPKTPIPVDSTHIFGFSQVVNCMSFQSTGIGSYYDSTFHPTVSWQYYFEYKTKEDLYALEKIACNTIKLTGGEGVERIPYFVGYNDGNNKRWSVRFDNNESGDVLEVNCNTGWSFVGFVSQNSNNTILAYLNGISDYVSGEHKVTIPFKYLNGYDFRLLFKKNNETAITYADWSANCSFKLYKPYTNITNIPQKEISILFIGNSLTQDSISYLPWLMCLLCPEVKFRFYVWYVGGKTLAQHLEYFQNDTPCEIFSVSEQSMRWTNYNNSKTMSDILSTYKFDVVCLQEYFNYKSSFTEEDKQTYQSVIDYITTNYSGVLKFISLFHQPKRDSAASIFNVTMQAQKWYLANTITESMLSPGIAIYRALSTDLDELGDQGHLSPDGTHAQEGLPCVMQAYTVLMWIYKHLGIPKSVYNFRQVITNSVYVQNSYTYINVPGPNIGTGVISGTTAQNLLAQQVAIKAFREGECIVNNAYDNE